MKSWTFRKSLALAAVLTLSGCSGDDSTQPDGLNLPTFTNIWPAGMGQYWVYSVVDRLIEGGPQEYENIENVPPIPGVDELYADLQSKGAGLSVSEASGDYRLEFTSEDLSDPDVQAFVVERSWENTVGGYPDSPSPLGLTATWTRSSDRIAVGSETDLHWVHLDGALNPDHEFRVQLWAGLTGDIFLNSRIWRYRSFNVLGEILGNCLESFYVLDLGIQQGTDENGEATGFFRAYVYGMIVYAPGVGPVYCLEKGLVGPGFANERLAFLQDQGEPEVVPDQFDVPVGITVGNASVCGTDGSSEEKTAMPIDF